MIAEIEVDIKGVRKFEGEKGIIYFYRCLGLDRDNLPYTYDIGSNRNTRKVGVQKMKVDISSNKVTGGLKMWEVG
jgi:hypothetical protein